MSYARDPVELTRQDQFAYSKRTYGYVPKTTFYKEETGNPANKFPVEFFQDFGVPDPKFRFTSIDENYLTEYTLSELMMYGEEWLLSHGFTRPSKVPARKSTWAPVWPPRLNLLEDEPLWRSVDFEEDRIARRVKAELELAELEISITCKRCARLKGDLSVITEGGWSIVHGSRYESAVTCEAHKLHEKRGTILRYLPSPQERETA